MLQQLAHILYDAHSTSTRARRLLMTSLRPNAKQQKQNYFLLKVGSLIYDLKNATLVILVHDA